MSKPSDNDRLSTFVKRVDALRESGYRRTSAADTKPKQVPVSSPARTASRQQPPAR